MEVKLSARRLVQLSGPDCCRDVFDRADNPILMIDPWLRDHGDAIFARLALGGVTKNEEGYT